MSVQEMPGKKEVVPLLPITLQDRMMADKAIADRPIEMMTKFDNLGVGTMKMKIPEAQRDETMAVLKVKAQEQGLFVRGFKGMNENYEFELEKVEGKIAA